jgi:hypothetical protein
MMKRPLTALVVAGTLATATMATPTSAHAYWRGWGWGLGGLALGLTIAALARPAYAYYPAYSLRLRLSGVQLCQLWLRLSRVFLWLRVRRLLSAVLQAGVLWWLSRCPPGGDPSRPLALRAERIQMSRTARCGPSPSRLPGSLCAGLRRSVTASAYHRADGPLGAGFLDNVPPSLSERWHRRLSGVGFVATRAANVTIMAARPHPQGFRWRDWHLEDAADNHAVFQHVGFVVAPLAGQARGVHSPEDQRPQCCLLPTCWERTLAHPAPSSAKFGAIHPAALH